MVFGSNKQQLKKRQPAGGRLSRAVLKQPARRWRAKRFNLTLFPLSFSRHLVVSVRRFRTPKNRRSKQFKQLVFPVNLLSVREIAIAIRRKPKRQFNPEPFKLLLSQPRRAAVPLALLAMGISGAAYFGLNLNQPAHLDLVHPSTASIFTHADVTNNLPKTLPRSLPVHLRIPSIGVDTDLTTMGLSSSGSIQMPVRYDIAAWYTGSPTPGQLGPAIIAGHVDNYRGIGVFFYLKELQVGASIEVDRADGTTATFKISEMKEYSKTDFPTQKVYGNINYAGIRLITCGGTFSNQNYEYSDNIVAFGSLE